MRHVFAFALALASLSTLALASCGGGRDPAPAAAPLVVDVGDAGRTAPLATTDAPKPELARLPPGVRFIEPARDPRKHATRPRRPAILQQETAALDNLLAATPSGAPDRLALLRRVAEDYCELARGLELEGATDVVVPRSRAVQAYTAWLLEAPATQADADEVRYYLGLERERSGNLAEARRAYFELIAKHPSSKRVPAAYFAFGEMFYAEARGDASKVELARQAYDEVLKYPPPVNGLTEIAKQRLEKLTEMTGSLRVP